MLKWELGGGGEYIHVFAGLEIDVGVRGRVLFLLLLALP